MERGGPGGGDGPYGFVRRRTVGGQGVFGELPAGAREGAGLRVHSGRIAERDPTDRQTEWAFHWHMKHRQTAEG